MMVEYDYATLFVDHHELRIKYEQLLNTHRELLAMYLETTVENLDPKDVLRMHRPSYNVLYIN